MVATFVELNIVDEIVILNGMNWDVDGDGLEEIDDVATVGGTKVDWGLEKLKVSISENELLFV